MMKNVLYTVSIKRKLQIIFGIMIATTIVGVVIGCAAFSRVQVGGRSYSVIEQNMLIADNIAKLRANLAFVRLSLLTMIIEDGSGKQQTLRHDIEDLTSRIEALFDLIDDQLKKSDHHKALSNMAEARKAWSAFRDTRDKVLIPAIFAGKIKEAMALARGLQAERYDAFSNATKEAVDHVRADVPAMVAKIKRESNFVQALFIAGSVFFIAFFLRQSGWARSRNRSRRRC